MQKPEFLHPAIDEINKGIEKALSLESANANISARIKVFANSGKTESSVFYSHSIVASRLQTGKPIFISEKQTSLSESLQIAHENIYFDGESYYISTLGVHAKVPESGAESVASPKDLLFSVLKSISSNEKIISSSMEKERNLHLLEISAEKASVFFPEIFASLHKRAESIGTGAIAITVKKCELSVSVDANGFIEEYALQVSIAVLAETEGGEKTDYTLTANISASFSGAGSVHEPQAPEDLGIFVPMESQKDIPLLILKLASDKNTALLSFAASERLTARKKELSGAYSDIDVLFSRLFSDENGDERWFESADIGGAREFYFRDGLYYAHIGGKTEQYEKETFASTFGFSQNYMPDLTMLTSDVSSYEIFKGSDGGKVYVNIALTDEALRKKFAEHIGKSACILVDGYEVWSASASGGTLEIQIGESGYIEEYTVKYDIRVIANINGSKFAFSGTVQGKTKLLNIGEKAEVPTPEWYESYIAHIQ